MPFELHSSAFTHRGAIPTKHTCHGADLSPPLDWSGAPPKTQSFALVIEDPDAPDPKAPERVWVHWILYNIPPGVTRLEEGLVSPDLPPGVREGKNDWGERGYRGPCPPVGRHRYFHRVYALETELPDLGSPSKAELDKAMAGHVLGVAERIGTYQAAR